MRLLQILFFCLLSSVAFSADAADFTSALGSHSDRQPSGGEPVVLDRAPSDEDSSRHDVCVEVVVDGALDEDEEDARPDEVAVSSALGETAIRQPVSAVAATAPNLGAEATDHSIYVEEEGFNVGEYFDREAYIGEHIHRLRRLETVYDIRSILYNGASTVFMWGAGLSVGSAAIVSILSSANIIDPHLGNVITACLSTGSGIAMWAGSQLKNNSHRYEEASRGIKTTLGLPASLNVKRVDIRIDPLRIGAGANGDRAARRLRQIEPVEQH